MIVYGLFPDDASFKRFILDEDYALVLAGKSTIPLDVLHCQPRKKAGQWRPPAISWYSDDNRNIERYQDPDISYIDPGSFIIGTKAANLLRSVINDVAELLPIPFNNEMWYFLNVFNEIDSVDKENSKYKIYRNGQVGYLLKPAFYPDRVPHGKLFTVAEFPAQVYYAEHYPDDDPNTFKNVVEKNKLFGIKIEKVWEG